MNAPLCAAVPPGIPSSASNPPSLPVLAAGAADLPGIASAYAAHCSAAPAAQDRPPAQYDEALRHMRGHLFRLAERFRVDVEDVRQTLYLVWNRLASGVAGSGPRDLDGFYRYLYRCLENELIDTLGGPQMVSLDDPQAAWRAPQDGEAAPWTDSGDDAEPVATTVPAVDEQIRQLFVRGCCEIAFPEAVRSHPLYELPSYRTVIEGMLRHASADELAGELGVTRRRVNAQIEDIIRIFAEPDPCRIDRILRAVPEDRWLPSLPLVRRPVSALRWPGDAPRTGRRVIAALRRYLQLGVQPAIVHVDQFNRVLSGVEVCAAARLLGIASVATLLQVLRGANADLADPVYRECCDPPDGGGAAPQALIDALRRLADEGYLSPLAAAFLEQIAIPSQYVVLREIGTALLPLVGVQEGKSLVRAARDGRLAEEARALRTRLAARVAPSRPAGA